ncbi:MAG: glycosyltransferase [Clostridia bacterium]|nr:glycosyltransferase [Clostridia bacterium]
MKVLWVSNSPIGPAAEILGEEYRGSSGGWITSEFDKLDKTGMTFSFLATLPGVKPGEILHKENGTGAVYCLHAPRLSGGVRPPKDLQELVQKVVDEIKPDLIQIWGTETWLSNAVARAETSAKKVIFIQGLIGVHQRYLGGYFKNNLCNRPFCRGGSLLTRAKAVLRNRTFRKQAAIEKETISLCGNVIVDSDFARSYCAGISENVRCYTRALLPNELFYQHDWSPDTCEKDTVFTIYGSNSEKGTQNLLWALSLLKRKHPRVKAVIPGPYRLDPEGKLLPNSRSAFQTTLYRMITALGLEENVVFPGRLSAQQMAETMEKCAAFANTSCMEVHALSLREAMVVGLPCVTSLCGSVGEYVRHGENGILYRYEEFEALAYQLDRVLSDRELAVRLSRGAKATFDTRVEGSLSLSEIYGALLAN